MHRLAQRVGEVVVLHVGQAQGLLHPAAEDVRGAAAGASISGTPAAGVEDALVAIFKRELAQI